MANNTKLSERVAQMEKNYKAVNAKMDTMNKNMELILAHLGIKCAPAGSANSGRKDGGKKKPEGKKPTAAELKAQKAKDAKFLAQWKYLAAHSKGNVRVDLKVKKGYRCLVEVEGREPGAGTWSVRKAAICVGYKWDGDNCRYEVSNKEWNAICDRFEALSKAK